MIATREFLKRDRSEIKWGIMPCLVGFLISFFFPGGAWIAAAFIVVVLVICFFYDEFVDTVFENRNQELFNLEEERSAVERDLLSQQETDVLKWIFNDPESSGDLGELRSATLRYLDDAANTDRDGNRIPVSIIDLLIPPSLFEA